MPRYLMCGLLVLRDFDLQEMEKQYWGVEEEVLILLAIRQREVIIVGLRNGM